MVSSVSLQALPTYGQIAVFRFFDSQFPIPRSQL